MEDTHRENVVCQQIIVDKSGLADHKVKYASSVLAGRALVKGLGDTARISTLVLAYQPGESAPKT